MKQLPYLYKVHLNTRSPQFLDVPFNNGNYSVAPLKHAVLSKFPNNKTFHQITSSSQITSDESILSLSISRIVSQFLKQAILTILPK